MNYKIPLPGHEFWMGFFLGMTIMGMTWISVGMIRYHTARVVKNPPHGECVIRRGEIQSCFVYELE